MSGNALGMAGRIGMPLIAAALAFLPAPPVAAAELLVFAAASLKNALDEANVLYGEQTGTEVKVSYAGTPTLVRQIEAGAPADVFLSADLDWMTYVGEHDLVAPDSVRELLANQIVLIGGASEAPLEIAPDMPLLERLGDGRLAMANAEAVPAGRYGKAALESLGLWDEVAPRIVQAENVRVALAYVARGEAPLGIVYRTDAAAEPGVSVLGTFPDDSHPPIVYPAAVTKDAPHPEVAVTYLDFLLTAPVREIFERWGFTVLGGD